MSYQSLTLEAWCMGRDKLYPNEFTTEAQQNALNLIVAVNSLLEELKWTTPIVVSSGWRPASLNATVKGAAKKSGHVIGKAVDFADVGHKLYDLAVSKPDLLRKYGLFVEDKSATPSWVHFDNIDRADRPSRTFKP
jgi:uncharacterized protein YcbK (DUF882 family)